MPTKILVNVFFGVPPEPKSAPLEFSLAEVEVVRDALRLLRDSQPAWKTALRNEISLKMANLSSQCCDTLDERIAHDIRSGR